MNARAPLLFLCSLVLCAPGAASGQEPDACDILDSRGLNVINRGSPFQVVFLGGPVIACPGGVRISADSAVMSESTRITEFIGRVNYQDTVKALTTDYAQYHENDRRLVAQGSVVLRDLEAGSVVEAPFLDYYQTSDTRLEELVRMSAGRPRATLVRDSRAEPGTRDTTIVDADQMEIHGQTRFIGSGNVEITRAGTKAYAQSAEFEQGGGTMRLTGQARIDADSLRMAGDSIFAETTEEDEFRELVAWGDSATLDGEAVDVNAPWIRILFEAGEVERLVAAVPGAAPVIAQPDTAMADSLAIADSAAVADTAVADTAVAGPPPQAPPALPAAEPRDPDAPHATAVSADFRLVGDSIDARLPGRVLDRVTAVGNAFGERLLADDTLSAALPEIARRDWMEGIVIEATFTDAPESRPDTAADRVLEAITATGEPARSIYRRLDADDPESGYAISYILASRIRILLDEGEVRDVEAEGAQGLYLQPIRAPARAESVASAGARR
jgi:LptA/(LptD N-terminal domain) LPS transport protein